VGQKKRTEKTAEEQQAERVTAALEETDRTGRAPAFIKEDPGQFLRDMYDVWHRQGGKEGGRWRNSIRKMREQWLVGRNHVPSLHPKLMGRVKLTRSDVRALVGLFLERWRYGRGDDPLSAMTDDGYLRFRDQSAPKLRDALLKSMFQLRGIGSKQALLMPVQSVQQRVHGGDLRVDSFIESEYAHCDALITFSRSRIAVGPTPQETMKGFVQLFYALFREEEKNPKKDRCFIWVIDFGQRLIEIEDSFYEYYNAGFLSLLFRAFASFDSETDDRGFRGKISRQLRILDAGQRMKRWQWLSERSVVIVENLRLEEIEELYPKEHQKLISIRLRDSRVTQQHILPREVPPNWLGDLRGLVEKPVDMANISTTVLIRKDGWPSVGSQKSEFKYYAHARVLKSPDDNFATATVQSTELSQAGDIYDDAFRLMHLAAACRLKQDFDSNPDGATALAYLRKLDFHVLRISDFIKIQSLGMFGKHLD
jgi:hypothetical protein